MAERFKFHFLFIYFQTFLLHFSASPDHAHKAHYSFHMNSGQGGYDARRRTQRRQRRPRARPAPLRRPPAGERTLIAGRKHVYNGPKKRLLRIESTFITDRKQVYYGPKTRLSHHEKHDSAARAHCQHLCAVHLQQRARLSLAENTFMTDRKNVCYGLKTCLLRTDNTFIMEPHLQERARTFIILVY